MPCWMTEGHNRDCHKSDRRFASANSFTGVALRTLGQGNELQLKELDVLRADVAEKDALVASLTQAVQTARSLMCVNVLIVEVNQDF